MKHWIQTLGILVIASSFAFAQNAPKKERNRPNPEAMFKKLDSNGNGSLSLDEFKASPMGKKNEERATKAFGKMDADSDGSVSLDEFKARGPSKGKGKGEKGKGKGKGKGKNGGAQEAPAAPQAPASE